MRQSIGDRIYSHVYQKVKELAIGTMFDLDVSACYAPDLLALQQSGGQNLMLVHSWLVTISTRHPLVDRPAIAASLPVNGIEPPMRIFDQAVEALWPKIREGLDEAQKLPPAVGTDLTNLQLGGGK